MAGRERANAARNELKLSVCIVTYNHESLIRPCIESAVSQNTSFDYEVVVGEDCSTDGTRAVLEELASLYPDKLRVMCRPQNLGAEKNFNTTISECRGEYIAFLEGDNFWTSPDKLQKQVDFLELHRKAAFCFHRTPYIDAEGARMKTVLPLEDPLEISDSQFLFQDFNPVPLGSVVARRALLKELPDWVEGLRIGDWPLVMLLASKGKIGFIPEEMSIQRVHKGGAWQLLPDTVQIFHILTMLNHVAPRLGPQFQDTMRKKIGHLRGLLLNRIVRSDADLQGPIAGLLGPFGDTALSTDELEAALLQLRSDHREMLRQTRTNVDNVTVENNRLLTVLSDSQRQLARARMRPMKNLGDFLKFRFLAYLSNRQTLFSPRRRERFARSAEKRDPGRSLIGLGQSEGSTQAKIQLRSSAYAGHVKQDPAKQNVLVISHEASRTGAPILALNIAHSLAKQYNVTTLTLREGALLDSFRATSTDVFVAKQFRHDGGAYRAMMQDLSRKRPFAFAVVNSLESRGVLQGLNEAGVPILSLIHEFASYTNPKSAILDVFEWSTETIFSTNVTLENALQENGLPANPDLHVLPQGKCSVPPPETPNIDTAAEVARLTRELRPESDQERRFLVVGAGTVIIRKGVDLFIEVATRVLASPEGDRFRFAWIGSGYNPDKDLGYSAYLRDQLRRAGIADRVLMLEETSEIETVYQLADAFVMSSRLDPLPNVAIDSLVAGLPVFCFDRTTGIADILASHGLSAECVARYLDTSEMAEKLLALAASDANYSAVSSRCRDLAATVFDFDTYVGKIVEIAQKAQTKCSVPASGGSGRG